MTSDISKLGLDVKWQDLTLGCTILGSNTAVTFTPVLSIPAPGWGLPVYLCLLLLPAGLRLLESLRFRMAMGRSFPKEDHA